MIERYSRKEIKKIWEEKNKYQIWLDIEIAAAQAMEKLKVIPKGVAAKVLGLRALSYNFETIKGKVYIAGITSNKESVQKLVDSIRNIKGVKEIVNYTIIKDN